MAGSKFNTQRVFHFGRIAINVQGSIIMVVVVHKLRRKYWEHRLVEACLSRGYRLTYVFNMAASLAGHLNLKLRLRNTHSFKRTNMHVHILYECITNIPLVKEKRRKDQERRATTGGQSTGHFIARL